MTFNIIELENWDRKEYFEHYFNQQTTYSLSLTSFSPSQLKVFGLLSPSPPNN